MKKAYYILLGILLISLVAATIPVDNWDFKDYYNLTNVNNLTSNYLSVLNNIISSGNVTAQYFFGNGSQLIGITHDNESWNESYADTLYVNITGDTMTGNLIIGSNNFSTTNVGIGTVSPGANLEIKGGGVGNDQPGTLRLNNGHTTLTADDELGAIEFWNSDTSSPSPNISARIVGIVESDGRYAGLSFETGIAGSATEAVRIDENGKVGIGTTSPGERLDVQGNISVQDMIIGQSNNVRIGDAGVDTHSLTADDDLFVSGKLEVDGDSYFDGIVNFFSTIGTALNLGGNDLQNVTNIDGYEEVINMEDNVTFAGDKDIHYGEVDINNDLNPQADIKQGDTNNLLLFNRTINGTHIIFDSPQGLPFIFKEDLDVAGNITGNQIYGEMYCKNDTGCGVVDLVTQDVYVAMANQTAGNLNGFTLNGASNLTAQVSGLYQVNAKASISGGTPAGDYGMKLYLNETGQNNCYDNFKVSADHISMIITCLVRINAGQNISIRFDDHMNPVTDITIYATNVNLLRIGN